MDKMNSIVWKVVIMMIAFVSFGGRNMQADEWPPYTAGNTYVYVAPCTLDTVDNVVYMVTYKPGYSEASLSAGGRPYEEFENWQSWATATAYQLIFDQPAEVSVEGDTFNDIRGWIENGLYKPVYARNVEIQDSATFHLTKSTFDAVTNKLTREVLESTVTLPVTSIAEGFTSWFNMRIDEFPDVFNPLDFKCNGGISRFKFGRNVNKIGERAFQGLVFGDTCLVIPASVDTICSEAFWGTQILNGLKFEYSPKPLVFEDKKAAKIQFASEDDMHKLAKGIWDRKRGGPYSCPPVALARELEDQYCSSVFYGGWPIYELAYMDGMKFEWIYKYPLTICALSKSMLARTRSGQITVAPCVGTLFLDREIKLNLYDSETGNKVEPVIPTPFGPQGFGTLCVGEHIQSLPQNFTLNVAPDRQWQAVIFPHADTPINVESNKWDGTLKPMDLENLSVNRDITPQTIFNNTIVKSVFFGSTPEYTPAVRILKDSAGDDIPSGNMWMNLWDWVTVK